MPKNNFSGQGQRVGTSSQTTVEVQNVVQSTGKQNTIESTQSEPATHRQTNIKIGKIKTSGNVLGGMTAVASDVVAGKVVIGGVKADIVAELNKTSLNSTVRATDGDRVDTTLCVEEVEDGKDAVDAMHVIGNTLVLKDLVIAQSK